MSKLCLETKKTVRGFYKSFFLFVLARVDNASRAGVRNSAHVQFGLFNFKSDGFVPKVDFFTS